MVVQNNLENFGKMNFYSVPPDSPTKLLGPAAARDALEKDPAYAKEKTLLRNPRVGDNLLYRIGNQEVYFIPVYSSSTSGGGVVQLGTIGVVGASVTGNTYVGIGNTAQQAFENYLLRAAGLAPVNQTTAVPASVTNGTSTPSNSTIIPTTKQQQANERILGLEKIFVSSGLTVLKPTAVSAPLSFKEADVNYQAESQIDQVKAAITKFLKEFSSPSPGGSSASPALTANSTTPRIFEWHSSDNKVVNYGILKVINGIIENHYISIHFE